MSGTRPARVNIDSYGIIFAIIMLDVFFIGTGFTKRDMPFGPFLIWVEVVYTLVIINYRTYIATHR